MDSLISDVRFAFRTCARRPGQTTLAIVMLALGIGASSSMFSIVDAVLIKPLPYPNPEELVSVYPSWPELRGHPTAGWLAERGTYSWPEYFALRERQTSYASLAAYDTWGGTVTGDGPPERIPIGRATWELFPMLGALPVVGRVFNADDDPRAGTRVVLLTAGYWQQRFGADRSVVGRAMTIDDERYTIVGVLPSWFRITGVNARAWIPRTGSPSDNGWSNHGGTRAIGRLKPGVSISAARDETASILRVAGNRPDHGLHGASVFPRLEDETREARPVLIVLIAAAFVLLAVGCGNVAALTLGAGIEREQELSVRAALGASRSRVAQLLLTESVVLTLCGAVIGVALTFGATKSLAYLAPPGVPRLDLVTVDTRVLAFTVAVSMAVGIVFGLIPALGLSGTGIANSIISSRGTIGGRPRVQAIVVVGEIALATLLLVSGALLVRTLFALNRIDPGFQVDNLLVVRLAVPYQRFSNEDQSAEQRAIDGYFQQIVDQVRAVPGVTEVAVTDVVPLTGDRGNNDIAPADGSWPEKAPLAERRFVSANYFDAMRIPILEGRAFETTDDSDRADPVVILSEGLARLFWPNESAVNKQIRYWSRDFTVVGVAANVRDEALADVTAYAFYSPMRQWWALSGSLVVRTDGVPTAVIPALRERVWAIDSDIPITSSEPMTTLVSDDVAAQRYRARLMVVFAGLAGIFAALGVYGVTARMVARRTREMAIRLALGAERREVMMMVLKQGIRLAVIGGLIGMVLSVGSSRFLSDMLFGVTALDPIALGTIAGLVAIGSVVASWPPSRRATTVDPMTALRE